jgi:hypothetical protein
MLSVLRALVWLTVSAGLLLAGFAALAVSLVAVSVIERGGELPGLLQRQALGVVFSAIATQALLPELALTFASWLVVARVAPRLERSGRALAVALPVVGALWFPLVGQYLFTIWSPTQPRDYVATLGLVAGGASLALLLPRRLSSALAPGCFTAPPRRGMVEVR